MSLPKRFGRNLASSYLLSGVVGVVALVTTPVLVHGLGKEAYGVWTLASSLVLYFKLLEFGVGKAIPRYLAVHTVEPDDAQLSRALSTALALLCSLAAVALVLASLVAAAFPDLFVLPSALRAAARISVAIVFLDLCSSIAADAFGWTLIGLQRFDLINLTLIGTVAAQAIGWVAVIALGGGLVPLAAITLAISLVGQLVRYVLARHLLPGLVLAPRKLFDRQLVAPFLRRSSWIGVIDVATIVVFRVDVVVVGLIVSVPAAAVYSVGQKLTFALEQLIAPTTKAFFPHASELAARRDVGALRSSLLLGTRMSLLVATPLALTLSLLSGSIVRVWVGPGFDAAARVIVLLSSAAVVVALTRTGLLMLQGATEPRVPALIYGAEALVNLGLSLGLAFEVGSEGVALGTLIAAAGGAAVFVPYLCRQFQLRLRDFLVPLLVAHVPSTGVALGVGLVVAGLDLGTIPEVLAACVAVVGSYLLVFAWTGLTHDERQWLVLRIRDRRAGA